MPPTVQNTNRASRPGFFFYAKGTDFLLDFIAKKAIAIRVS
jgi:hypothetical protein